MVLMNCLMLKFVADNTISKIHHSVGIVEAIALSSLQKKQKTYEEELTQTIAIVNTSFLLSWLPDNIATIIINLFRDGIIRFSYHTFENILNARLFLNPLFSFMAAIYLIRVARLRNFVRHCFAQPLMSNAKSEDSLAKIGKLRTASKLSIWEL